MGKSVKCVAGLNFFSCKFWFGAPYISKDKYRRVKYLMFTAVQIFFCLICMLVLVVFVDFKTYDDIYQSNVTIVIVGMAKLGHSFLKLICLLLL